MKRGVKVILVVLLLAPFVAGAAEYTSSSFRVLDPVFELGGAGEMTSSSFRLYGSVAEIGIGTSSASTLRVSAGSLYFPKATIPSLTPTAGNAQVSFSWTISVGFLGWTVSGYNIGRATLSGGPYTYSSVGSTTAATISGLANGTTYYFVIRSQDAFGNSIATSTEVSATPAAVVGGPAPTPAPVGGGGILEQIITPLIPFIPFVPEFASTTPPVVVTPCASGRYDLDCDGIVGITDLSILLYFVPQPAPNPADFNDDRIVDVLDISELLFGWTERLLTLNGNGNGNSARAAAERAAADVRPLPFAALGEAFRTEISGEGSEVEAGGGIVSPEDAERGERLFESVKNAVLGAWDWIKRGVSRLVEKIF